MAQGHTANAVLALFQSCFDVAVDISSNFIVGENKQKALLRVVLCICVQYEKNYIQKINTIKWYTIIDDTCFGGSNKFMFKHKELMIGLN